MWPESYLHEREFHDAWARALDPEDFYYREFFEACTAPENRFILSRIGNLTGKRILDLGTGPGEASVYFREKGADVISFDLSEGMLKAARERAGERSLDLTCVGGNATQLPFQEGTFDIVYGANILHHVPFRETVPDVSRVLKPGGRAYFTEPLAYNPVINIYRRMAANFRTPGEKAFRFGELKIFEEHFGRVEYHTFWLFTLWIFLKFFLVDHVSPSKERYWKKILKDAKRLEPVYRPLEQLEGRWLKRVPALRYLCWNVVVLAEK